MTDLPLSVGDRIGDYEIIARVGAGGMGEVFRARDTRLGRDVAIKVLPPHLADDPDRKARFEREARFLGALSHPNIGGIHGFVSAGGVNGLALEFIDGPDLSDKIATGPLSVAETMAIARQIAAALDAAHERGIIHRDLKPANIKIGADGTVKVLDFGIAKAIRTVAGDEQTRTADGTEDGTVLGTVGYMSPEQTRGLDVDKRTDIWAFGCIVFEMLTGHAAFARATSSDTIAAILERDPEWSRLPSNTPPLVQRMLRRCLEKDVKRRQRDIADAAAELTAIEVGTQPPNRPTVATPWLGWIGAAALGGAAVLVLASRDRSPAFDLSRARLDQLTFDSGLTDMPALSPDGKLLVYASDRTGRGDLDLYVEQTSGGAPIRLTDDPADDVEPAFSPDGSQIVFRSERAGGGVYLMPALGGDPRLVVERGRWPRFAPDGGRIAYWTGPWRGNAMNGTGEAFTLDLGGGEPVRVAKDLSGAREPVWSPDGRSLVVVGRRTPQTPVDLFFVDPSGAASVATGVFDKNDFRDDVQRMQISSTIIGDWTADGVLMSTASGLWLLPIDLRTGGLITEPRRLSVAGGRHIHAAADTNGTIVFAMAEAPRAIERAPLNDDAPAAVVHTDALTGPSRPSQTPDGSLIIYDRRANGAVEFWLKQDGVAERLLLRAPREAADQVISPDAKRIAYSVRPNQDAQAESEGYAYKVAGGVPTRICSSCEVWGFFSDSRRILILDESRTRLRALDLESGDSRVILKSETLIGRTHLSPDDRHIAFNFQQGEWLAPINPNRPTPQSEWRKIDQQTVGPRACGWSMDSQIAYLLLDTDGFRCLWGQRVDPKTTELIGKPFAVRHFHHTVTQEFSTTYGNAISTKGFLYGGGVLKANLWRLTLRH